MYHIYFQVAWEERADEPFVMRHDLGRIYQQSNKAREPACPRFVHEEQERLSCACGWYKRPEPPSTRSLHGVQLEVVRDGTYPCGKWFGLSQGGSSDPSAILLLEMQRWMYPIRLDFPARCKAAIPLK